MAPPLPTRSESNQRDAALQTAALPTELRVEFVRTYCQISVSVAAARATLSPTFYRSLFRSAFTF